MSVTLNVYVKDKATGAPIGTARVVGLTKNQIIDPPVRQVSGDGGANLYFQGPPFTPPVAVTLVVDAPGYAPGSTSDQPILLGSADVNYTIELVPFRKPLRVPTREQVCNGQTTQQGLTVTTAQFGAMPWWGGCWAWLTPTDRAIISQQLLAHGDTVCLIQVALDGRALYDEPNQFYSVDKFPPLQQSLAQTVALVREALALGFEAVWLFLDGDNGSYGFPVAVQQVQELGPMMGALNQAVCYMPGWDGVFYGYTPQQVADFATAARATGAIYVGVEGSTGHIPAGNGDGDYAPAGLMTGYDVILGEFNDGQFDDTVWQILGRMVRPYVRPANQPSGDDPNPPFYLQPQSARGPYYFRLFEYGIYGWVRGTPAATIANWRAQLAAMAPGQLIC